MNGLIRADVRPAELDPRITLLDSRLFCVSFVCVPDEGIDFIGEHPELRFHDSPHESAIDLRIAVDQNVAEGNYVVMLADPSRRLSIGFHELVQ